MLNTEEALLKLHSHINLLIYTVALYKNRRVLIRLTILNKYLIEKVFGLVHSSSFGLIFISLGPKCSWSNIAITSSAWIRSCKRGREEPVTAELQCCSQLIHWGSARWEQPQQALQPRTSSVAERTGDSLRLVLGICWAKLIRSLCTAIPNSPLPPGAAALGAELMYCRSLITPHYQPLPQRTRLPSPPLDMHFQLPGQG